MTTNTYNPLSLHDVPPMALTAMPMVLGHELPLHLGRQHPLWLAMGDQLIAPPRCPRFRTGQHLRAVNSTSLWKEM